MTNDDLALELREADEGPSARWVVFYVLAGKRHATEHAEGCKVLARARLNQDDDTMRDLLSQHGVIEAGRYARAPEDWPAPKTHSCIREEPHG